MTSRAAIVTGALMGLALMGCGESGDPTGLLEEAETQRQIKAVPSFSTDIQEIILRVGCTDIGCHGSGQGALTLGTDVRANWEAMVGVRADTERQYLLVQPFNADSSYVVVRFEDRQAVGLPRMPVGPPLDEIDLTNWKNWIDNGAALN